jgi:hypothetical protein
MTRKLKNRSEPMLNCGCPEGHEPISLTRGLFFLEWCRKTYKALDLFKVMWRD